MQGVDAADVPAAAAAAAAAASSISPTASLVPACSLRAAAASAAAAPAASSTSRTRPAPPLPSALPAVVFPRLPGGASMLQEDDNYPEDDADDGSTGSVDGEKENEVGRCRLTQG